MNRCETRSISIAAPPSAVLDFVGDARTLPRWAPAFTTSVEPDGEHWRIDGDRLIDVRVSRERGTVDLVAAGDPRRGAFTRVIANGEGSEYLFTLQFPNGTGEDAVARQMAVVEGELRAVRDACQV
jgi:Polyketide cyclase / dehydrase and lipid transport